MLNWICCCKRSTLKTKKATYIIIGLVLTGVLGAWVFKNFNFNPNHETGEPIDSLNNVVVYYNGGVNHVMERNVAGDGYNLGLKYQCVEFVKRYYYEHLDHKMPDSYGHAKDFFDKNLTDGQINPGRDLIQFINPSETKPKTNDLLVFRGTVFNTYGHVAIISKVTESKIEIIQQNPGPFGQSRETFDLLQNGGKWKVDHDRALGWLRKK